MNIARRLIASAGALALFVSVVASSNAATSDNATVVISPQDNAGITASITGTSFGSIQYSFADSAPLSGSLTLTALDTRGNAAGWNIVLSATNFTGATTGDSIPVNRLNMTPGAITALAGSAAGLTTFPLNPVSAGATKIWSAAAGAGDGSYSLNVPASLVVPGGTLVDSYTSVVTVSIVSGP